jgi:hypothetical protein
MKRGEFIEKVYKHRFCYEGRLPSHAQEWFAKNGATHAITMEGRENGRAELGAIIGKTVARVIVDENESGAVWEKWDIRQLWEVSE